MPKNIVICSDGTGNTANKGRGTNVFKLFEALDLLSHRGDTKIIRQVAFYDDGVGTDGSRFLRIIGGAFGYGLARNVRELYRAICRCYEPGDQIYLFGFSRGAFTVRTLAGLLLQKGIVPRSAWEDDVDLRKISKTTWDSFRSNARFEYYANKDKPNATSNPVSDQNHVQTTENSDSNERNSSYVVPCIRMIGVWDTVSAYGFSVDYMARFTSHFHFPDQILNPSVKKGCHALSLDDERDTFWPTLWDSDKDAAGDSTVSGNSQPPRIEQVWFAGVHSNVGGGYVKQGMSLVTLDWMLGKAEKEDLRFHKAIRDDIRQRANVNDMLYNPRSGLGEFYRYAPRDIALICRDRQIPTVIHDSVFQRLELGTSGYAPGELPADFSIISSDPEPNQAWQDWTKALSNHYKHELVERPNAFKDTHNAIWLRRYCSYRIMHVVVIAALIAAGAAVTLVVGSWFDCIGGRTINNLQNMLFGSSAVAVALFAVVRRIYTRNAPSIELARSRFWRKMFAPANIQQDNLPEPPNR